MAQSLTQIPCPSCSSQISATIDQLIDVDQDPSSKSRLLSGSLNLIKCPVCGHQGQVATPLVYHDPEHELLLTFIPVELHIPKDEQERLVGRIINQITSRLAPEDRKGYLLQPQPVLTMQSLVERVLEADGITREQIDAQRARMLLFEDLIRLNDDDLETFIAEHDEEFDAAFFQIVSLTLQASEDSKAKQMINDRLEKVLQQCAYGKQLQKQQEELQAAVESINQLGEEISRENLLELFIEAPNNERVVALANLIRPALDYQFFQLLTERIDANEGEVEEGLVALRTRLLEITQHIDRIQAARAQQASSLLESLIKADDLDKALQAALPLIDDLFLSVLQANLQAAIESNDAVAISQLEEINKRLQELVIPPGIQLAQQLLEIEEESQAEAFLEEKAPLIDDQLLNALMSTAERLSEGGDKDGADRLRNLYRQALKISMRMKMKTDKEPE